MSIVTIPKKITRGEDLVIIPRGEYEHLLELKKIYEFRATSSQKKALSHARRNRKKGRVLTLSELRQQLGTVS